MPQIRLSNLLILVIALCSGLWLFSISATAAPACHQLDSSTNVPTNYGASYDTLNNSKPLLIQAFCSDNDVDIEIGDGLTSRYVYKYGYIYKNNNWQQINFTPTGRTEGSWYIGKAKAKVTMNANEFDQESMIAAFVCTWSNNTWKCGCRDSNCNPMYWQIQKFKKGADSPSEPDAPIQNCTDQDQDGYTTCDGDCDDNEYWANPGNNNETCDTIDNNCNNQTDEGCDDDNDKYCDQNKTIYRSNSMCPLNAPGDYVNGYAGDDCKDNNASIKPGVSEVCGNNQDDNCNNQTDEGCALTGPTCGQNGCETSLGESCSNCPADCGTCEPLTCNGTTYYVSNSGNDANNGQSEATPWQTISKVNSSTFSPGDCILFKAGDTWRETLTVPSSGSSGNPISLTRYGTGKNPLILTSDYFNSWQHQGNNLYSGQLTDSNVNNHFGAVDSSGVRTNWYWPAPPYGGSNWVFPGFDNMLPGFFYSPVNDRNIYFKTSGGDPGPMEVGARLHGINVDNKDYIVVDSIDVHGPMGGNFGETGGAILIKLSSPNNIQLRNFTIKHSTLTAIEFNSGQGVNIVDNLTINDGKSVYIQLSHMNKNNNPADYTKISNSKFLNSGQSIPYMGDMHFVGITASRQIIVEDSYFENRCMDNFEKNCGGAIVSADSSGGVTCDQVIIRRNYLKNIGAAGIQMACAPNSEVYSNIVDGFGNRGGPTESHYTGIKIGGSICDEMQNIRVYNNLITNGTLVPGFSPKNNAAIAVHFHNLDGLKIKNNIFYNNDSQYELYYHPQSGSYEIMNNIFYHTAQEDIIQHAGNYAIFGQDGLRNPGDEPYNGFRSFVSGNKFVNPQLVDPGNGNFRLQSGSPARDAGVDVGLNQDIIGTYIPQGSAPDIGAYEYTGSTPTQTTPPSITAFSISPGPAPVTINDGQEITAHYTVVDFPESSLVQLYRTRKIIGVCDTGDEDECAWKNVRQDNLSSESGSLKYTPPVGTWLFGLHVDYGNGQWVDEGNLGRKEVTVTVACDCSGLSCNPANNGQKCDGCNYASAPAEVCNNNQDDDCDGQTDEGCGDGPYPSSQIGITFDFNSKESRAPGSDNWPITWADDGHQYTSWGDGGGFGGTNSNGRVSLGIARVEGTKDNYTGYNVWGGINPENPAQFDGKSYGIISINSTLYMWWGPGSNTASYSETKLFKSADHGATWTKSSWDFTDIDSDLIMPTICNFGKDYAGARDNYVYHYFIRKQGNPTSLGVHVPGKIDLARVPKGSMMTQASYEFFTGLDGNGNPTWSSNASLKQPVFEDAKGVGWNLSVSYNAPLGRYFLMTEHTESDAGNLGIFDAPEPWGPWTTTGYYNNWGGLGTTFFWNFSNKWLSADGKDFVIIFTGTGSNDTWNTVNGSFIL